MCHVNSATARGRLRGPVPMVPREGGWCNIYHRDHLNISESIPQLKPQPRHVWARDAEQYAVRMVRMSIRMMGLGEMKTLLL